jgi:hypothetical protein
VNWLPAFRSLSFELQGPCSAFTSRRARIRYTQALTLPAHAACRYRRANRRVAPANAAHQARRQPRPQFRSVSVELDAIDPRRLRSLLERAKRKHMPKKRYDELMAQEERERQQIRKLVDELDIEEPDEAGP